MEPSSCAERNPPFRKLCCVTQVGIFLVLSKGYTYIASECICKRRAAHKKRRPTRDDVSCFSINRPAVVE